MDKNENILPDNLDERIESFLRGTMTLEEESAFKQEIKTNPELRNRAMSMTALIKGIQEKESKRDKAVIASVGESKKPAADIAVDGRRTVRHIFWWAASIAAACVIVFFIYKDQQRRALDSMLSPYYIQYTLDDMTRGDVDSVAVVHLYELFNQVQEKRDVSDVIKELELIYYSLDFDYTYYPWANDIAWNLSLAYIKNHQIDKALVILDKLKNDNPDTPISAKADELMKRLKER